MSLLEKIHYIFLIDMKRILENRRRSPIKTRTEESGEKKNDRIDILNDRHIGIHFYRRLWVKLGLEFSDK